MNLPANPSPVNTESATTASAKPKKLLDKVRDQLRLRRYSLRTERAYWQWIVRFLWFCRDYLTSPRSLTPSPSPIRWARVASVSPLLPKERRGRKSGGIRVIWERRR